MSATIHLLYLVDSFTCIHLEESYLRWENLEKEGSGLNHTLLPHPYPRTTPGSHPSLSSSILSNPYSPQLSPLLVLVDGLPYDVPHPHSWWAWVSGSSQVNNLHLLIYNSYCTRDTQLNITHIPYCPVCMIMALSSCLLLSEQTTESC